MPRKRVIEAGAHFANGELAEVAELLDDEVLDAAESREVADRIRFVRALALFRTGNPQGAAAALAGMEPAQQQAPPALRLAAAVALAAGDMTRAKTLLGQLVRTGAMDAIVPLRAVVVRCGLAALASRNFTGAADLLGTANLLQIPDLATRYAAWLGLLAATHGAGDHQATAKAFAMFPDWARDQRANLLAARAAVARLDVRAADAHLRALGPSDDAWPLWWSLCRGLFAARRFQEVVAHFGEGSAWAGPEPHARSVQVLGALSLYALGRAADAHRVLHRLAHSFPEDRGIAHAAAFVAFAAGDPSRAESHLHHVPEDHEPARLLRWAIAWKHGKYELLRDALTPEAVRTWPAGPERDTASIISALTNTRFGETSRALAVLRDAGARGAQSSPGIRYLMGYVALAEKRYPLAAAALSEMPLGALARLEVAREKADAGDRAAALADLEIAMKDEALRPHAVQTKNLIRLQQAYEAVLRDDMSMAGKILTLVRTQAPLLSERVAGLEDYVAVRGTLMNVKGGDPTRVSDILWELHAQVPPGTTEPQRRARQRDLSYLSAVMRLRAVKQGAGPGAVPRVVEALEASLAADAEFAPAAAMLGVLLQRRGNDRRALDLLDVAQRHGFTSAVIQAALAVEYVHSGRLLEAKRIFVDQLAGAPDHRSAGGLLRDILAQENLPLLRPSSAPTLDAPSSSAGPQAEVPDLPVRSDPFAGTDPKQRVFVLIHHAEARLRAAPDAQKEPWMDLSRQLKRLAVQSTTTGLEDLEKTALALLHGGAP